MNALVSWLLRPKVLQAASNMISVLMGIFLGLALADVTAGTDWLYRWSTLITGFLALAAGVMTVMQMQATDTRQQLRHEDLARLTVRADKLRALRAAARAEWIVYVTDDFPEVIKDMPTGIAELHEKAKGLYRQVLSAIEGLENELKHRTIQEAHDLFDPGTVLDLDNVHYAIADLRKMLGSLTSAWSEQSEKAITQTLGAADMGMTELHEAATAFASDLEQLGKRYQ